MNSARLENCPFHVNVSWGEHTRRCVSGQFSRRITGQQVAAILHMMAKRALMLGSMLLTFVFMPLGASAVTIDQIVAMSKAGVSDSAIIAMIERDRTVFALDPAQLVELQQAGVSGPVTVAMIRTGNAQQPPDAAMAPETPAAAPDQPSFVTYAVPYAVPVFVPVRRSRAVVAVAAPPPPPQAASARGMFFTQPATGIFFRPPADANCPAPAVAPHPR